MSSEVEVVELPDCDICRYRDKKEVPAIYDAKTKQGPWAYLCDLHFNSEGIDLGTGFGQRLVPIKDDHPEEEL